MKVLKKLALAAMTTVAALSLTSCDYLAELLEGLLDDGEDEGVAYVDNWAGMIDETKKEWKVEGNTMTYGNHTYTIVNEIDPATTEYKTATASVTFTNIPSGFREFAGVYHELLGKSIAGTAAMIPMAMELYARDAKTGDACLGLLCNSSSTADEIVRILKDRFIPTSYSPENDQYIQRFIPAALLKGATPDNAYKPSEPYTVEMTMSPNGVQDAPLTGGEVTYIYILAQGWDTFQRGVDIFESDENEGFYKVFNCPSCYTQCKPIKGTWGGLK